MAQNRAVQHVYLIPIFLYLALLLDGIVMNQFSGQFLGSTAIMTPRFLLMVFVLFTVFFPKQPLFMYALLFGFIYDSFYSGILGIYAASLAVIVYVIKRLQTRFFPTPFITIIFFSFSVIFLESFVFGFYTFLGYTGMTVSQFINMRLGPTLLLNFLLFLAIYYPVFRLSQWMYE